MVVMKNPFKPGDVVFFERGGIPTAFFNLEEEGEFKQIGVQDWFNLKELIEDFRVYGATGPYLVTNFEDWSAYDFSE
jgi:hypothetical protein